MTRYAVRYAILALLALSPVSAVAQDLDLTGVSGNDMLGDSTERIQSMELTLQGVYDLRDETQSEDQDLTKLRCINDKIAAIQGFLRLSADSMDSLHDHINRNDRDATEHQYTLIVIASQRVGNLRNEATQCAGDILTFSGDTEHSITIDPQIPEEDTTDDQRADADLIRLAPDTPLPESTPFQ